MDIRLSTLSVILGLIVAVPSACALLKPKAAVEAARKFARHTGWGWALMLTATAWFIYNVSQESVQDFANMKKIFYLLFGAVGIGSCIFVRDFLSVRGLAVIFLLAAKLMTDAARWEDTDWRLVISLWAYVLAVAGMWFTISPWRLRDIIDWATANEQRLRMVSAGRLAFGLFVVVLGLTVFRAAEKRMPLPSPTATQQAPMVLAS